MNLQGGIMRKMKTLAAVGIAAARAAGFVALVAAPALAWAEASTPTVPEPETLALLGVGAIALVIARWAKRK
jgi:PEP-CTERM motif